MAATIISIVTVYAFIGAGVAVIFLLWGIARLDENARNAWAFRPLMAPGVILLWPIVLWRWARLTIGWREAGRYLPPRRAQRELALLLAFALPVIILTAILIRQSGPFEASAITVETTAENVQ